MSDLTPIINTVSDLTPIINTVNDLTPIMIRPWQACFYVNDEPESKFLYIVTIKLYCIVLYHQYLQDFMPTRLQTSEDVPLVEFEYSVFKCMPGESYRR